MDIIVNLDTVCLQSGPFRCCVALFNTTHVHFFQEELNGTRMRSSYCVFFIVMDSLCVPHQLILFSL